MEATTLCNYEHFIKIIEQNLAQKEYDAPTRKRILNLIQDRYKDSEIFKPIEDCVEDEEIVSDFLSSRANTFGSDGFACLDEVPRQDRVEVLRKCYEDHPPFRPSETIQPINEKGKFGRTLLHEAVMSSDKSAISRLLKKGANPYAKDNNGNTPLTLAKFNEDTGIVDFLVGLGICK